MPVNTFSVTLENVILTLLYLSAGFVLSKARLVQVSHVSSISTTLLYFCGPCMFINALTKLDPSAALNLDMFLFLVITFVAQVLFMLIVYFCLGKHRNSFTGRMVSIASVMGNAGFFGLPIVSALFSYLLVLFLPLSDVFKASILILSATPCASIILNLAEIHHSGEELAANCTLLSTLISLVTIPLLSLLI